VYQTRLAPGLAVRYELKPGRGAFLHVATGAVTVNGRKVAAGDAVAVEDERLIEVTGSLAGEVLLFDLA
jgi:redox-sensitive bicupin YhaK (pirin superfamily)